ncbi:hypothetical protein OG339_12785 [Streptosporangium sp. NBC_01495]|uniref:hypothetical protein n=1 Tax=Streptosporangium sp. NBC_01495 TaxID=2903899 RepID=UPI002E3262F6|nr:hypothetical protein [Streptosporangium sp. NBC_01495]
MIDSRIADRGGSGAGNVVALRPGVELGSVAAAAEMALAAFGTHLDRYALAKNTVTAYRRQVLAYREWLLARAAEHADAFVDLVGAEVAVTAWRRGVAGDYSAGIFDSIQERSTSGGLLDQGWCG